MNLHILGKTKDFRTNTNIVYGQINIEDYLILIGEDYDSYGIQRRREKHKAYARMKNDIIAGALLPTITLAVNEGKVNEVLKILASEKEDHLKSILQTPGIFSILDGLQRTYILHDIKNEGHIFNKDQKLLLEFWIEPDPKHIIYRLIVLNAGQKPMSLRHQIELLFMTLAQRIKQEVPDLEIFKETETRRRSQPGQFPFERLVTSYQAFLWKTPELNKSNLVAQQMMEDSVTDSSEDALNYTFNSFIGHLKEYTDLDRVVYKRYSPTNDPSKINWLSLENVMTSFFAAITDFGVNENRIERINVSTKKLQNYIAEGNDPDPLGLDVYFEVIQGIETRKINVGLATRRLLFSGFKEYFREEGEKTLAECWRGEAS